MGYRAVRGRPNFFLLGSASVIGEPPQDRLSTSTGSWCSPLKPAYAGMWCVNCPQSLPHVSNYGGVCWLLSYSVCGHDLRHITNQGYLNQNYMRLEYLDPTRDRSRRAIRFCEATGHQKDRQLFTHESRFRHNLQLEPKSLLLVVQTNPNMKGWGCSKVDLQIQ